MSSAVQRNREPILQVLKKILTPKMLAVLEMGSGSGEHAVFFAPNFPWLEWTTTDQEIYLPMIESTLQQNAVSNVKGPLEFEIGKSKAFPQEFDLLFTANTFHIMAEQKVREFIQMLASQKPGIEVVIYGPFNRNGQFTSPSNQNFDVMLKQADPLRGLRNFEDIVMWMQASDLVLITDYEMPSNNRILHFRKR